jgi:hypothetical protein
MTVSRVENCLICMTVPFKIRPVRPFIVSALLSICFVSAAQRDTILPVPNDTLPEPVKKRFWRASGELMLAQVVPWSVNYFIRKADFAKIGWSSIAYNLNPANWEWDDNKYTTNQIAHPYHGSLYYSAFRSNGYNFWQSVPAAFAGSFMWEVAGETHPAAPNDFINTSLGGISLGEMSYRISSLVVNERKRGFGRTMQEIAAFVINPMNGFNRLIDGKWNKISRKPNPLKDRITTRGLLDIGARQYSERIDDLLSRGKTEWYAGLRYWYGDALHDYRKPFDNFYLQLEIGGDDTARLNIIRVAGNLYGWKMHQTEKAVHTGQISLNYDYFRNSAFFFSGQSANFNVISAIQLGKKTKLESHLGAGWVILAAVPDEYLYYGEGRNYNYGTGLSLIVNERLHLFNSLWVALNYRGALIGTINGNQSGFHLHATTAELRYFFTKNLSAGMEAGHFVLIGNYATQADVHHNWPYLKASVGIGF